MSALHLSEPAMLALRGGAWLAAGALIGALHFVTLRWNVRMFAGGRTALLAVALQIARFALLAGALAVIAGRYGALPLLLATAGILLARTAVVQAGGKT